MIRRFLLIVSLAAVIAMPVAAQEEGGGGGGFSGGGAGGSGLPSGIDAPRTIPQQFASKLKLDATQRGKVDELLAQAAAAAAAPATEMLQLRQRMLNAARADRTDELKAAEEAYVVVAARVATIEATTFAKVYAELKPNQQKEASEAFALIAGLFSNTTPAGAGGPRGGMRGQGGAR